MIVNMYICSQAGFRGIAAINAVFGVNFELKPVSYGCVRQWVLRLGYGLLDRGAEKRDDWIYILDFSIQLGKERCFLILGVSMETINSVGYELGHRDVRVFDIHVRESFSGEVVLQRLQKVKEKNGTPVQVICDNGNDVKNGVTSFCGEVPGVIDTYDITHMIGVSIKHSLKDDGRWSQLQDDLRCLAQQIKQSDLSFLRPIALSKKARWLNVGNIIEWLDKIFKYEEKGDFGLISKGVKIVNAGEIFDRNKAGCKNKYGQKRLQKDLKNTVFYSDGEINQMLGKYNIPKDEEVKTDDAGKLRFQEKFADLKKHRGFFNELLELNNMAKNIKSVVKKNGLSLDSLQTIENGFDKIKSTWVRQVFYDINNKLQAEHSKCGALPVPLLCCSDIIESIFGKFKIKARQAVGGIYETVLCISLFCTELTEELINEILTSVKMTDVDNWFKEMAGVSNLAKRRIAFKE